MKLPKEFKLEITRGHGPGGQHKNKVETCAIITHLPTGLSQTCQDSRSQKDNIETAYTRLLVLVTEYYNNIKLDNLNQVRKGQINNGERSFRRRTYDYKSGIVTDHTTGKKASLFKVLDGAIELLR
jgi:peptide chain release factor 1